MDLTEQIADELALETLGYIEKGVDERIVSEISELLGASSQTLQEAYLTAVRVRRAETRARNMLAGVKARLSSAEPD